MAKLRGLRCAAALPHGAHALCSIPVEPTPALFQVSLRGRGQSPCTSIPGTSQAPEMPSPLPLPMSASGLTSAHRQALAWSPALFPKAFPVHWL